MKTTTRPSRRARWIGAGVMALSMTAACGDDDATQAATTTTGAGASSATGGGGGGVGGGGDFSAPYDWESRFVPGESAVSYTGQTFRHALIAAMDEYIGGLTAQVAANRGPSSAQQVVAALDYYYQFDDATSAMDPHTIVTDPMPLQSTWSDIASDKDLKGKFAGNDDSTDHRDWDGGQFVGWADVTINGGNPITSPEALLRACFQTLGTLVEAHANGNPPDEPGTTTPIVPVHVTADGLDLQELIQKLLLVGVTYAQTADDYLDDATPDKGLLSPNTRDGDAPYTVLGHAWDEGFGYFGAARDYSLYTDEELAGAGGRSDWQVFHDTDGDAAIDLTAELNWATATYAAKRDLAAVDPTDFTKDAFDAFVAGRELILDAGESLTADELAALTGYAEAAVEAWEKSLAANVVHYLNEVVADTEAIGTDAYVYGDHAKHFSEMKAFALGLQFNPKAKIGAVDFAQLHVLLGDRPVLADASAVERTAYVTALVEARGLIQSAYGFSAANVEGW